MAIADKSQPRRAKRGTNANSGVPAKNTGGLSARTQAKPPKGKDQVKKAPSRAGKYKPKQPLS